MDVITRCCHCNCVKTKYGTWLHNVKIRNGADDSDFLISDGCCNPCLKEHYPEQYKIMQEKKTKEQT